MFLITSQQSREDAKEIGEALSLSEKTVDTINSYPLPELMDPRERFSAFTHVANDKIRRLVGTVKNVASREPLYAAASDNETFDRRTASLGNDGYSSERPKFEPFALKPPARRIVQA
jgi:hypothetical protein